MREYNLFIGGCSDRHEREMHMAAWHAANLMNMWSKKRVKIDDLLGKKKGMDISMLADRKKTTQQMLDEALRKREEAEARRYYGD